MLEVRTELTRNGVTEELAWEAGPAITRLVGSHRTKERDSTTEQGKHGAVPDSDISKKPPTYRTLGDTSQHGKRRTSEVGSKLSKEHQRSARSPP